MGDCAVHLLTARNAEQNRIDTGDFLFAGHLPKEKPRPSHDGRGSYPLENFTSGARYYEQTASDYACPPSRD
jgi:hypothetical protein